MIQKKQITIYTIAQKQAISAAAVSSRRHNEVSSNSNTLIQKIKQQSVEVTCGNAVFFFNNNTCCRLREPTCGTIHYPGYDEGEKVTSDLSSHFKIVPILKFRYHCCKI